MEREECVYSVEISGGILFYTKTRYQISQQKFALPFGAARPPWADTGPRRLREGFFNKIKSSLITFREGRERLTQPKGRVILIFEEVHRWRS